MEVLTEESLGVLKHLETYQVRFILVGGYAVNYYGHNRSTGDMDLWISSSEENKKSIANFMKNSGYSEEEVNSFLSINLEEHKLITFEFGTGFQYEMLTSISGFHHDQFEECYSQANSLDYRGVHIHVLHLNHLIENKIKEGRVKDYDDVKKLQELQKHQAYLKQDKKKSEERKHGRRL